MQDAESTQPSVNDLPLVSPDDARDCLQCLIIMYGETHIDTLAQLLNLTAYAETEYSHLCVRRSRG